MISGRSYDSRAPKLHLQVTVLRRLQEIVHPMFASLRLLSRRALVSQVSRVQSLAQAPLRQFSSEAAAPKSGGSGGTWVSL